MRVITDANTKHLKQKAARCFDRHKSCEEEAFKDILFKDRKTKQREWQNREVVCGGVAIVCWREPELKTHNLLICLGNGS